MSLDRSRVLRSVDGTDIGSLREVVARYHSELAAMVREGEPRYILPSSDLSAYSSSAGPCIIDDEEAGRIFTHDLARCCVELGREVDLGCLPIEHETDILFFFIESVNPKLKDALKQGVPIDLFNAMLIAALKASTELSEAVRANKGVISDKEINLIFADNFAFKPSDACYDSYKRAFNENPLAYGDAVGTLAAYYSIRYRGYDNVDVQGPDLDSIDGTEPIIRSISDRVEGELRGEFDIETGAMKVFEMSANILYAIRSTLRRDRGFLALLLLISKTPNEMWEAGTIRSMCLVLSRKLVIAGIVDDMVEMTNPELKAE